MIKFCQLIAAILFTNFCWAQKSPVKFGDIPMSDLQMTVYEKDSSAAAVILADYGEAYLSVTAVSATLNFERHVRIKILNNDGLKWGDVSINLFHNSSSDERVSALKAVTYNLENGKVVESKLSKDGIFKEKFNRFLNVQKFTMPNVKVGSVIEYSYTLISEFVTEFPNWQFQYDIPVRYSEFWARIPSFFVYEKYMQGYLAPTKYEVVPKQNANYDESAYHWIIQDVPAFKEEPYMTSESDYVSKINFALSYTKFPNQPIKEIMGSWEKLAQQLQASDAFGGTVSGSNFLKKDVQAIIAGISDETKKLDTIYKYVKTTLEWDGTKDYLAGNLKKIFESRKGTAGDINLALAAMLDKAGFDVDLILLSTRDHGFIREQYPMERQFNYVICSVDIGEKNILLDATERFLPLGVLPERCLNGRGLMISKTKYGWVSLEPKVKSRTVVNADFTLADDGHWAVNYK